MKNKSGKGQQYNFTDRFRTCTKGKHPKTHKQTHKICTQVHYPPFDKHYKIRENMRYIEECQCQGILGYMGP